MNTTQVTKSWVALLLAMVAVMGAASPALATTVTYAGGWNGMNTPTVSNSDLINGLLPVATPNHGQGDVAHLTDGTMGGNYEDMAFAYWPGDAGQSSFSVKYALDTVSHPYGYDIFRVNGYAAASDWRANQLWYLWLITRDGAWHGFGYQGSFAIGSHLGSFSTEASVYDDTGAPLATNVVGVQVNAVGIAPNGGAGSGTYGSTYREFDVFGTATQAPVPEPLTIAAIGLGIAGVGGYIRRRRITAQ